MTRNVWETHPHDMERHGTDKNAQDMARHGTDFIKDIWHGMAWHDMTRSHAWSSVGLQKSKAKTKQSKHRKAHLHTKEKVVTTKESHVTTKDFLVPTM